MESHTSGTLVGTGSFRCTACDYVVSLAAADRLPPCPNCAGSEFVRASLFTAQHPLALAPSETIDEHDASWLADIRLELDDAGQYLVYEEGEAPVVHRLDREWTRVGRSLAADIRFDDPTVSRRHALVVRQPDGVRVLDDRSLNGVFVNGERVEWRTLADGDELVVGRHRLHFVELLAHPDDHRTLTAERATEPLAG
ncbi:MAG TPA: FHA domain-containing protein [Conexibacter sp.]|nr:FHA domain-containing protein [Conexibacter sp.]